MKKNNKNGKINQKENKIQVLKYVLKETPDYLSTAFADIQVFHVIGLKFNSIDTPAFLLSINLYAQFPGSLLTVLLWGNNLIFLYPLTLYTEIGNGCLYKSSHLVMFLLRTLASTEVLMKICCYYPCN